jgi:gamma-tubulin complex component 3
MGVPPCRAGWDVFSLRYTVEEPLASVVTDAAVGQYHAVARLLWALKRAEHSLSASWLLLNGMERALSRMEAAARRSSLSPPGTIT